METPQEEQKIKRYFEISILVKGAISLAEVLGGLLVLVVPPALLTGWIISASNTELIEDPGDFVATHSLAIAQQFAVTSGTVIAVYLLTRGLIKLALVLALLKNKLWAYPASLVVLGLFIVYQLYELLVKFSSIILTITIFDLIVVYFIWREYVIIREHLRGQAVD